MREKQKALLIAAVVVGVLGGSNCVAGYAAQYRHSDVEVAIKQLQSGEHYARKSAAYHIGEMGPEAKDAVPALIAVLQSDENDDVCGEVSNALAKIGPDAEAAVPALLVFLKSGRNATERSYAVEALGNIGKQPDEVVPVLMASLKQDEEVVQRDAARALGRLGEKARPAIPILIENVKTAGKDLREASAVGLAQIPCSAKEVPAVNELLGDEIDIVRQAAAQSLAGAGSEAAPAVPGLIKLLDDQDHLTRHLAVVALEAIGPYAKAAIPALTKALKDDLISGEASDALKKIKGKN